MKNLAVRIFNLIIGYLKSLLLSWIVLPIVGALIFISTAFSGSLEFILRKFSYLFGLGTSLSSGSFNGGDIMRAFALFSLGLYFVIEVLKFFGLKIIPSFRRGFIFITSIFLVVILLVLYPTSSLSMTGPKSGFIFVFSLFWGVSSLAYIAWYFLNRIKFRTK